MSIKVIITKQEMWDLGFEKFVIDGEEYVDKGPLLLDSTCDLAKAYYNLLEQKKREALRRREKKRVRKSK